MAPFIALRWDGCTVRFPDRSRRLSLRYCAVSSERLRAVLGATPGARVVSRRAISVSAHEVTLADGRRLGAPLVIDGRGLASANGWGLAWQVFAGLQVRLAAPHGLAEPVIMDATVPQGGAYRFIYCLPFSATEILIEDTRYQDGPGLDEAGLRAGVLAYARSQAWQVEQTVREESGALPIVLSGRPRLPSHGPVPAGMRAGLFHPVTGYSLPDAVRLADLIAGQTELTTESIRPLVLAAIRRQWRKQSFYRLLNRMLFMAGRPDERWRILSRFYALPEPLIGRFYAGATTTADMMRILTGRPPVPILGALACLRPGSARGFIRMSAT
jgi:lycopene beta-cyclase